MFAASSRGFARQFARRSRQVRGSRQVSTAAPQDNRVSLTLLAGGALSAAVAVSIGYSDRRGPLMQEEVPVDLANLDKRVGGLEISNACGRGAAFVFIKPHAVTGEVKDLVARRFEMEGISIISQGSITAEDIDKDMLIDTHYGAIAAKAMKQKPADVIVQQKAQDEFQKAFGLAWKDALDQGLVYNLKDAAEKLDLSMSQVGDEYDKLKKGESLLKFGGGFYCGKVQGIYVINGFYARMREQFTTPGTSIHYYQVEWDAGRLSWADFRGKVLGGTDPKTAWPTSLRNAVFRGWQGLGLDSEPNTGNNGLHASASPLEALAERANWLGMPIESDMYGRAMLATGVPLEVIKAWCEDPAVRFEGKSQSLFDLLEDLDSRDCLKKSGAINVSK
uniref:Nucleoside-diphosphate kinase n=1 Tax=Noctiluca scintillans TaxID=2966 RepID=A0A7S0ZRE8_NOCSC